MRGKETIREKIEEGRPISVKKKLGFSEKLVIAVLMCNFILMFLAVCYAFENGDTNIWSDILQIPLVLTPSSVGFFIWKAKSENVIKIENNPNYDLEQAVGQTLGSIIDDYEEPVFFRDDEEGTYEEKDL